MLVLQQPGKPIAVKTEIQQAMLALHRMRRQLIKFRTMQINNLRGLLTEYGEVMSKGRNKLSKEIPFVLERIAERLPAMLIDTFREQWNGGMDWRSWTNRLPRSSAGCASGRRKTRR
jgi:transposase